VLGEGREEKEKTEEGWEGSSENRYRIQAALGRSSRGFHLSGEKGTETAGVVILEGQ